MAEMGYKVERLSTETEAQIERMCSVKISSAITRCWAVGYQSNRTRVCRFQVN